MPNYSASCHCSSVRFSFNSEEIKSGMRCNCSICRRQGAVLTEFTIKSEQLTINVKNNRLSKYEFGTKVAGHYFCSNCGIFTFVQTRLNPGEYRINLGCIEQLDSYELPIQFYDGNSL